MSEQLTITDNQIRDYEVVCDQTNNSPEDIDQNRLNVCVTLKGPLAEAYRKVIENPDPTAVYMSIEDVYKYASHEHDATMALLNDLRYGGYRLDPIRERLRFYEAVMEMAYRLKELEK